VSSIRLSLFWKRRSKSGSSGAPICERAGRAHPYAPGANPVVSLPTPASRGSNAQRHCCIWQFWPTF